MFASWAPSSVLCAIDRSKLLGRWTCWSAVFDLLRLTLAVALLTWAPAASRGTIVFAGGAWAAIDRGNVCEALSRSQKIAPKDKVQAVAGVSFTADHRRWGEFHAQLSRMPRG